MLKNSDLLWVTYMKARRGCSTIANFWRGGPSHTLLVHFEMKWRVVTVSRNDEEPLQIQKFVFTLDQEYSMYAAKSYVDRSV